MKAASVSQLKKELAFRSQDELLELCLRLSKFKKENKELLTYLLFESDNEAEFVSEVKKEIDEQFAGINTRTWYFIKKSVRKILKDVKKHARYSGKTETEVELLIYFCAKLKSFPKPIHRNKTLQNLYERQLQLINSKLEKLHVDLQYDYRLQMEEFNL
ncbi:hypothetical protein [Salegentibacter sp.]|uniref:hypothetical protein n=1 Tax=Salegentibacter sp. TaxID=1903072 RepID=UPI00356B2E25